MPEEIATEALLRDFDLERGKYILAVGRLVPEKGFDDLVGAYEKSLLSTSGMKLVIAGEADHEDSYSRKLKESFESTEGIVFVGFQKGVALSELFTHAKLFVLPSYHEGLPIVLLEAMSYGLPCLASNIPANRNVSLSESRYFKVGDTDKLKEKLIENSHMTFDAQQKSKQIEKIKKDYNWNLIASRTVDVYKDVCCKV